MQNQETCTILERMIQTSIWMNIHLFGGLDGDAVTEIRVLGGYGARHNK
jgi:hypothetical protein